MAEHDREAPARALARPPAYAAQARRDRWAWSTSLLTHLLLLSAPPQRSRLAEAVKHPTTVVHPSVELALVVVPSEGRRALMPLDVEVTGPPPAPAGEGPRPALRPRRAPVQRKPTPQPAAAAPPAASSGAPAPDSGAVRRALERIARTPALTREQKRRAMLVVLRTWEDPSRTSRAEQLVDALLDHDPYSPPPP